MQRMSSLLPSWDKRNSTSGSAAASTTLKPGGIFGWAGRNSNSNKASNSSVAKSLAQINVAAANANATGHGGRVQREAFWPSTLDMECLKAARILKSFCVDGYLAPIDGDTSARTSVSGPQSPLKITKKIPRRIIQNAAGIAVFTCMRSGLWMTGSGGSGILIARKSDGTWSPPSGIMLHTPTLSFIIGVDVYDCVLVVTNLSALESITRPRVTLGEDVTLNNGPSVTMDADHTNFNWKDLDNTVLAYMKARGQHQAVNLQGCILTERSNENERFYGADVTQMDILAGNVARHVEETRPLFEVIKMAEGRTDYDKAIIEQTAIEPAPGDAVIATPKSTPASPRSVFGRPKPDDPDPFGVLALEMAGLEIREAGTRLRPASNQFEINSNTRSPTLSKFGRQSIDTFVSKSNRASVLSSRTVKSQMTDAGTQTGGATAETTPSPGQSEDGHEGVSIDRIPEVKEDDEVDYTAVDFTPLRHISQEHSIDLSLPAEEPAIPPRNRLRASVPSSRSSRDTEQPTGASIKEETHQMQDDEDELEYDTNDADDEDDLDDSDEEPVVFEVAQVQPTRTRAVASRMIQAKGSVVTIPKRVPPPLPTRSPARNSGSMKGDNCTESGTALSPLRQAFSEADLRGEEDIQNDQTQQSPTHVIVSNKSADLGQTHGNNVDDVLLGETLADKLQADEASKASPSTNEAVMPGSLPVDDTDEEAKHSDIVKSVEKIVPNKSTIPENVPLPADTDPEDLTSRLEEAESDYGSVEERATEDDESIKTPVDNSDSTTSKKHTSSIYTGMTEDRWSIDQSSLTTPNSERPLSVVEYSTEEDTPKKIAKEVELEVEKNAENRTAKAPVSAASEITVTSA
ncbi:SH3 domain-containing YSC84-like protein 1 [Metarhizium brunneum]|uniref:SH3 domain-containing YSC84-like protein 1 n=1 Tax=Metarhizium brunneum TaxID=500148 RepID=A0A7D5UQ10_9HYPO|nr:SH3 domain-containing YSC84-like protein 1 [Metarhizium brunneum]